MGYTTVYTTDEMKEKLKKLREKYRFRTFTEALEALLKVWEDAEKRLGYGGLMEFIAGGESASQPASQPQPQESPRKKITL